MENLWWWFQNLFIQQECTLVRNKSGNSIDIAFVLVQKKLIHQKKNQPNS